MQANLNLQLNRMNKNLKLFLCCRSFYIKNVTYALNKKYMDQESQIVAEAYKNDKIVKNEEATLWKGIFIMCAALIADLLLFHWFTLIK